MRSIRYASAVLTLAGVATFAGSATALANRGPQFFVDPAVAMPGQLVSFGAVCLAGFSVGTSATLFGASLGLPEHIAMEPSTHRGVFTLTVRLPRNLMAGRYTPSIDCSNDLFGAAPLTVLPSRPTPIITVVPVRPLPHGAPVTGDGATSTVTGGSLTAVGLSVLGLGGIGGIAAGIVARRGRKRSR